MKKALLFLAYLLLVCAFVMGGGGRQSGTAGPSVDRSNFNAVGTFPLVKNKETITIMTGGSDPTVSMETNWMTAFYEEKTNVHVNWLEIPADQFKERANLALASGDQIDALIHENFGPTGYTMTEIQRLADQRVILPIQNYIDNDTKWIKDRVASTEGWRDALTLPDGNIYHMPVLNDCYHCTWYNKMWINLEFLKNLNLSIPTTTEEFRQMLIAFRDRDANGNGDPNDEIPFMGAFDNATTKADTFLMSAFIYDDGGERLFLDKGKVTASYTRPEFQEGLRYLRQLYSEGLLSRDSFTTNRTLRHQLNSQKYESIIGAIPNGHHGNLGNRETGEPVRWIDYEPIAPLKGPNGFQSTNYNYYVKFSLGGCGFIPVTSRNPALVMRWLDWFMEDEGITTLVWGAKGIGWTDPDPGATGPDGSPARLKPLTLQPGDEWYGNVAWGLRMPVYMPYTYRNWPQTPEDARAPDGAGLERFLETKTRDNYAPYGQPMDTIIPPMYYQSDSATEMATLVADITTYVDETIAKFITGDMNIDAQWPAFQTNLKNLGLDRYLQIVQNTYDNSSYAK
jgi:putative aldouronate transport system substrate-binding protein